MKRESAPQEYTCRNCPERYYHAIPAPQKSKGLMMHFGESYCTLPKRARHLKSRDLNRRAPEWCPERKVPNTLRIYYYRSPETYMLDNVLHQGFAFTPLPTASRYAMAYEGTSTLSPREFWLTYHEKENDLEPCIGTCIDGNGHRHSNLRLCRHIRTNGACY